MPLDIDWHPHLLKAHTQQQNMLQKQDYIYMHVIFKPGAPGFLKLLLSSKCVCVSTPKAINNYSLGMKLQ